MPRVAAGSVSVAVIALVLAAFVCCSVQSQPDEAGALNRRVNELYHASKAGEAIPLAKRALEIREKTLPAGPVYKRALELGEKALPAGHPDIAQCLNNLALLYKAQGRLAEAEPVYKRVLEIKEKALSAGHPAAAAPLRRHRMRPVEIPMKKRHLDMVHEHTRWSNRPFMGAA